MSPPAIAHAHPDREPRTKARYLALIAGIAIAAMIALTWQAPTTSTTASSDAGFPIRAAFYYPWYPENWGASQFKPGLGQYDADDRLLIANHITQMQFAHIDAGIVSWWGRGAHEQRITGMLSEGERLGFKWTLYHEREYYDNADLTNIRADLDYIEQMYAGSPSYLSVSGKPVLFVFTGDNDGCARLQLWQTANQGRFYLSFRAPFDTVLSGCAGLADSWHIYQPGRYWSRLPGYSTTISPGFWAADEAQPRLARNLQAWAWLAYGTRVVNEKWQLITTWNEWTESTAIEPDTTHGFEYILTLNQYWADVQ